MDMGRILENSLREGHETGKNSKSRRKSYEELWGMEFDFYLLTSSLVIGLSC